ncbi:2-oxoacid:ferredoxin oxidoreductase, gamma subunit [Burkholderiales bacterium]|nr:2-oxoacid:ferredoxin oxidoreductase, gamma subunit [Burkholderiales bacterium]
MQSAQQRPITVLACALGGEGGGVLSGWLIDAARHAGYAAQSTSIPGVAQRTGATTYYLEFYPVPQAALEGRRPVFSLYPVAGQIDLLVSSELLEAVRQVGLGMADASRTRIISALGRTLTTAERIALGDGRVDEARLIEVLRAHSREHHLLDMARLTSEAGTVVSAVMLGTVAASGVLPFDRGAYEAAIKTGGRGAEASLRGFAIAFDQVATARRGREGMREQVANPKHAAAASSLPPALATRFPAAVHAMLALGHARVVQYQDPAYGALYVERLARVLEAERIGDPGAAHGFAVTREVARWLALWMAFDDIVRVADRKLRASRHRRVRAEVKAAAGDVVKLWDLFRPGVREIAALLPPWLAQALVRWDARRQQRGLQPWSFKLALASHTVSGALALRLLAALRGQRRRGQRYAQEQALIEHWLGGIVQLTREHWAQGYEVALCARLIKGYGNTNERGKENLLHVLDHLALAAEFVSPAERVQAIAQARDAALADDSGKALDQTLRQHGAAPRIVKPVPIRFVRRAAAPPPA